MKCPECGHDMTLLFINYRCYVCNPEKETANKLEDAEAAVAEFDEQKTPTLPNFYFLYDTDKDDDATLPTSACMGCGSLGFAGSWCNTCRHWRP